MPPSPDSPQARKPALRTVTPNLMITCCNLRAPRDSAIDGFLKKLTHLNLNDRRLDSMDGLQKCKNLKNLYLYNNSIGKLEHIKGLKNLTHLYVENNGIEVIENLPTGSLQKL